MSLNQFTADLRDNTLTDAQKLNSFTNFITYYNTLVTATMGTKTYSDQQLSEHIFKHKWKSSQADLIFEKHLYAAKNTLDRLSMIINVTNFQQYLFTLSTLGHNLFDMVEHVEVQILGNTLSYSMGSRFDQNAREVFDTSRMLFHISTVNTTNLYTREVIPVSVFLLRQTIEIYGKRMLGFYSCTDENGNRAPRVPTQIAWNFIKKEFMKSNCRISLPVNIDIILKVETWTNHYVHTGTIHDIYLIENAMHLITPLVYPQNGTMKNYKGSIGFAGTSTIKEYESLKEDFELYVNGKSKNCIKRIWRWCLIKMKIKKSKKDIIVNWFPIDRVDATILSL